MGGQVEESLALFSAAKEARDRPRVDAQYDLSPFSAAWFTAIFGPFRTTTFPSPRRLPLRPSPHPMAPRLNKRQLREQEELSALQDTAHNSPDEDSEPNESKSPVATSKQPVGGFAAVSTV